MKDIANRIGGIGCLAIAAWLYMNGHQNSLVVMLGILGAMEAIF